MVLKSAAKHLSNTGSCITLLRILITVQFDGMPLQDSKYKKKKKTQNSSEAIKPLLTAAVYISALQKNNDSYKDTLHSVDFIV